MPGFKPGMEVEDMTSGHWRHTRESKQQTWLRFTSPRRLLDSLLDIYAGLTDEELANMANTYSKLVRATHACEHGEHIQQTGRLAHACEDGEYVQQAGESAHACFCAPKAETESPLWVCEVTNARRRAHAMRHGPPAHEPQPPLAQAMFVCPGKHS